ncbi:DUF6879 family protein [Streptomyces sanyensis]|uniref:DUF6879 family protein n=1 Tax=Streptomyces sanyensis TaxID=568869 RepID=UPI003D77F1D2
MSLRFVGKDPESGDHGCPAVWVDEETKELVIQGVTADADTIARTVQFNVFDGEGRWVHTDQTDDQATAGLCADAFEAVWELATPHDKYTA